MFDRFLFCPEIRHLRKEHAQSMEQMFECINNCRFHVVSYKCSTNICSIGLRRLGSGSNCEALNSGSIWGELGRSLDRLRGKGQVRAMSAVEVRPARSFADSQLDDWMPGFIGDVQSDCEVSAIPILGGTRRFEVIEGGLAGETTAGMETANGAAALSETPVAYPGRPVQVTFGRPAVGAIAEGAVRSAVKTVAVVVAMLFLIAAGLQIGMSMLPDYSSPAWEVAATGKVDGGNAPTSTADDLN